MADWYVTVYRRDVASAEHRSTDGEEPRGTAPDATADPARLLTRVLNEQPAVVFGEAPDAVIAEYERRGVLHTVWGRLLTPHRSVSGLRRGMMAPASAAPVGPTPHVVELIGPLYEDWRRELEAAGAIVLERVSPVMVLVRLNRLAWEAVLAMPFVRAVAPYQAKDAADGDGAGGAGRSGAPELEVPDGRSGHPVASSALRRSAASQASTGDGSLAELSSATGAPAGRTEHVLDILVLPDAAALEVVSWLERRGVKVLDQSITKVRVAGLGAAVRAQLQRHPAVAAIEPYIEPRLSNDRARLLARVDLARQVAAAEAGPIGPAVPSGPNASALLIGRGQIIGIADTGIDASHPDFHGRLRRVIARGRAGDGSDPHGHGTHVAATAAGDGTASGGAYSGVAPGADLVVQSLLDAQGGLGGIPIDLRELLDEAYQLGVRVHNNSWGAPVESRYFALSLEADAFISDHPDFVMVIAAGNAGQAVETRHSVPGDVDWLSLNAPATCKNALVVGASRSDRASGGLSQAIYVNVFPAQFPELGVGLEPVSGDPTRLAGFSSRGPCDDRRVKPDLVAPGTDILSARSVLAGDAGHFWGDGPQAEYAYLGGTSMAAPVVAGCAALVREHLERATGWPPSAALVRAVLVNGASELTGPDALADHPRLPNMHQGFGAVDLARSLALDGGDVRLEVVDSWGTPTVQPLTCTSDHVDWEISLKTSSDLRCCLAYTDLPGRALQNNLNLRVWPARVAAGFPAEWVGNSERHQPLTRLDADNNLEIIRLTGLPPGRYRIQVMASNILRGPQDYALAVLGALEGPIIPASLP